MPEQRYYAPGQWTLGQQLTLEPEEAHHLLKVMRTRPGEQLELVNGQGTLATARLVARSPDVRVEIVELSQEPPAAVEIAIAQAIPRMNRLEYIVEKGTELGMTALLLFPGERSEKESLSPTQRRRLEALAIAAMKQSGRLHLPLIELMPPLDAWQLQKEDLAFYGEVKPSAPLLWEAWPQQETRVKRILFFVGPESGLSESEEQRLQELGARGVSLHHNVLRTDTAPVVALSLISHWVLLQGM